MRKRVSIDLIDSKVIGTRFDLEPNKEFWVKIIKEMRPFENGKYGETILGYSYECVDTKDFETYVFKIEGQKKPLMTNEELQVYREDGQRVTVNFVNATVMAYINEKRLSIEDSYKADDVILVEEK